jgi:hypothetical protein
MGWIVFMQRIDWPNEASPFKLLKKMTLARSQASVTQTGDKV